MAINQTATVETRVNDQDAKNKLEELTKKADELRESLLSAYKANDTKAIKAFQKELNNTNREIKSLRTSAENINATMSHLSTASIKELRATVKAINAELTSGHIKRGSQEWDDYNQKLKKVNAELRSIKAESQEVATKGFSWGKLADGFNRFQTLGASVIASMAGITLTARKCVEQFAQMQEAESQVLKYTDLTKKEVEEMNKDFQGMDTRTPREQLNALAGYAGQLGVKGKKDIEDFVKAADKINVALGEDIGQDAVKTIGRLAMSFGTDKTMGLSKAMLSTGSAINQLAQSVGSDASYLVDFTARVAGAAKQAKLSQADIIGFASVLNRNMQAVEMSGTAFQTLLMKMYQSPAKFAKLAGQDVKKFTADLNKNANETLLNFLNVMNKQGGLDKLAPMFKDMGLDGARASGVLATLANKIGDVRDQQKIANDAYREAISVDQEFNVQNNTVQAGLDKAKKKFQDMSILLGEKLAPAMKHVISGTSTMIRVLMIIIQFVEEYKTTLLMLIATMIAYNVVVNASTISTKLHAFWTDVCCKAFQRLFTVLKTNPWGAIIAVMAIAIGYMSDMTHKTDEATRAQELLDDAMSSGGKRADDESAHLQSLLAVARDETKSKHERIRAINEINKITPDYIGNLTLETINTEKASTALARYVNLLKIKDQIEDVKKARGKYIEEMSAPIHNRGDEVIYQSAKWLNKVTGNVFIPLSNIEQGYEQDLQRHADGFKKGLKSFDDSISSLYKEMLSYDDGADTITDKGTQGTGGGTIGKTGKKGKSLEEQRKERERKAVDALTAQYDKQKALETAMYASGKIDRLEYDRWTETADAKLLIAKMKVYRKDSKEYNALLLEQSNRLIAHNEKVYKEKETSVEEDIRQERNALLDSFSEGTIDRRAFDEGLNQLDYESLKRKRDIYGKGTKEYTEYQKQLEEWAYNDRLQKQEKYEEEIQKIKEYSGKKTALELMNEELKNWDELHSQGLIKEEVYQQGIAAIKAHYATQKGEEEVTWGGNGKKASAEGQKTYNKAKGEVGNVDDPGKDSIFDTLIGNDVKLHHKVMENLKQQEKDGLISHQEFLAAKAAADADYYAQLTAKAQTAYEQISGLMSAYSNYVQACSDAEVAKVTKRYDKEIKAAGENTAKGKQLEEKKEKEIAKIKSKYNKQKTKIQIAQAIADTAIGALKAYNAGWEAGWPAGPILAPIFAGIAIASGALQIASIKKQAEAQEAGYYEGGFTPSNSDNKKQVGVVHANEFVATHNAVSNPNLLPVLNLIDYAQRNNTVGSLTPEDVSRAIGIYPQNTISTSTNGIQNDGTNNDTMREQIDKNSNVIQKLVEVLEGGIQSFVTLDGEDGLEKQYKHFKKLQDNKSR